MNAKELFLVGIVWTIVASIAKSIGETMMTSGTSTQFDFTLLAIFGVTALCEYYREKKQKKKVH